MSATFDTGLGMKSEVRPAEVRLDETRRELRELFIPSVSDAVLGGTDFPRSKVMRALIGNRGFALLAIGAGGLLIAKSKVLRNLVRVLPLGAIVRMAAVRFASKRL